MPSVTAEGDFKGTLTYYLHCFLQSPGEAYVPIRYKKQSGVSHVIQQILFPRAFNFTPSPLQALLQNSIEALTCICKFGGFLPSVFVQLLFDPPALIFLWRLPLPVIREHQQQGSHQWFPLWWEEEAAAQSAGQDNGQGAGSSSEVTERPSRVLFPKRRIRRKDEVGQIIKMNSQRV